LIERQIRECSKLRNISIRALSNTLKELKLGESSENDALQLLIKSQKRFGIDDYWYPSGEDVGFNQFGCIVLFDTEDCKKRTAFPNARKIFSSNTIPWEGKGFFYLSPQRISKAFGDLIWGDFASSIYLGESEIIKEFFLNSWSLSNSIINEIMDNPNLTVKELFNIYKQKATSIGARNIALSKTGPKSDASLYNIGHSFPQMTGIKDNNSNSDLLMIARNSRIFIDELSNAQLEGHIWSLESRDYFKDYPLGAISFHRLFCVINEEFISLPDHYEFFKKVGMKWILEGE